jgi:hypothetical protein
VATLPEVYLGAPSDGVLWGVLLRPRITVRLAKISIESVAYAALVGGGAAVIVFNLARAAVRYQEWAWILR